MFQVLQRLLKENGNKYMIKYDGERSDNNYTVMRFDKNQPLNTKGKDTNTPKEVFCELLNDEETCKIIFEKYNEILLILINKFGKEVIMSLIIDFDKRIKFTLLVLNLSDPVNYSCSEIDTLITYCEELH